MGVDEVLVMYIAVISTAMSRAPLPQPMGTVRPSRGPSTDGDYTCAEDQPQPLHWKVVWAAPERPY